MSILGIKGGQWTRHILADSTNGPSQNGRMQELDEISAVSLWPVCLRLYGVQLCV